MIVIKTKKLKIGIFMDSFFPSVDGVVMVIDNLARCMSKFADVTLVVPNTSTMYEDKLRPYKVIRINSINIPLTEYRLATPIFHLRKFNTILENEHFDIIHIHSPFSIGRLGVHIAKKTNVPVIATMHTQFKIEFKRYFKSNILATLMVKRVVRLYSKCNSCIAVNYAIADIFKSYGYNKAPIVKLNGTDMELINNKEDSTKKVNKLYNIQENENVFLFVGRINKIKNIFFILDVMKILKKKNLNFKMLYVGTGPDDLILKEKIVLGKLKKEVILCGQVTDRELLKAIYYRANLFIFPSLFDASSLVQIEAASQKTPTIFIEGAVTANTITNNVNGFTAPNDVNLFADRIQEILNNNKLYDTVCENAYKDVYKNWETIAKETYEYYLTLINNSRKK